MTSRVEIEEIQATRGEKLLAWVLAGFLLVGGLWLYFEPLDREKDFYGETQGVFDGTPEEQAAIDRERNAESRLRRRERAERADREDLELRREAYRTALEAGTPAAGLERAYRRAESRFDDSRRRTRQAERAAAAARPGAVAAQRRIDARSERLADEADDRRRSDSRETFLLRLAYVLAAMAGAFVLFDRLRRRRSRYLTIGIAAVGFAAVQAAVMATDYSTDYIDVGDTGPAVLSLAGIAMTLAALVALQRYVAKRVPHRRVRRRECPFCGFPVHENEHCEGCGRHVIAECTSCGGSRRVGTSHCGICGAA